MDRPIDDALTAQHHRPSENTDERVAPKRQYDEQQHRFAPAALNDPGENQRRRVAKKYAERGDVKAELDRSPSQEAVKVSIEEYHVLFQRQGWLSISKGHLRQKTEIEHHHERQKKR